MYILCAVCCECTTSISSFQFKAMMHIRFDLGYEERILPYLLQSDSEELWLTGCDGSCTVHPELAAALFSNIVMTTSCIVVPDAPVSALKEVAQLLHLGRYLDI